MYPPPHMTHTHFEDYWDIVATNCQKSVPTYPGNIKALYVIMWFNRDDFCFLECALGQVRLASKKEAQRDNLDHHFDRKKGREDQPCKTMKTMITIIKAQRYNLDHPPSSSQKGPRRPTLKNKSKKRGGINLKKRLLHSKNEGAIQLCFTAFDTHTHPHTHNPALFHGICPQRSKLNSKKEWEGRGRRRGWKGCRRMGGEGREEEGSGGLGDLKRQSRLSCQTRFRLADAV